MLDFLNLGVEECKRKRMVDPDFRVNNVRDIMIRGGKFYAIWDKWAGAWSTDWFRAIELIDEEIKDYYEARSKETYIDGANYLSSAKSGAAKKFKDYCENLMMDNYYQLDRTLVYANDPKERELYSSKRVNYSPEFKPTPNWDYLMDTLYGPSERLKIEWCMGAIFSNNSQKLQKFLVFYGPPGSGKSTIINIICKMTDGYNGIFDAAALASQSAAFATAAFKENQLVAYQHDGALDKLETNATLNSIISHEPVIINDKYVKQYTQACDSFLLMGTNEPVRITSLNSGLMRRLIDCSPTGKTLPRSEYDEVMAGIETEYPGIANKCIQFYKANPKMFENYQPRTMINDTNYIYNFVLEIKDELVENDGISLKRAFALYNDFCEEQHMQYRDNKTQFKKEFGQYFAMFLSDTTLADGTRVYSYFKGFKSGYFENFEQAIPSKKEIIFKECHSVIDDMLSDCPAQLANDDGYPKQAWDKVTTKLKDIDSHQLHYVAVPVNHIVVDFDMTDENGNKSLKANLAAATAWPETYAELSKSGQGIHLHYIYDGDPTNLTRLYADSVEIKVFTGKSSLRRQLTLCTDGVPVATISGLPERAKKMISSQVIQDEAHLINKIQKALRREVWPNTRPSIDYIYATLEQAYESGIHYDLEWMYIDVWKFAKESTNQKEYCLKLVDKMHFKSEDLGSYIPSKKKDIPTMFDIEVWPNFNCLVWKPLNQPVIKWKFPTPEQVEQLCREYPLWGYNNGGYDNYILDAFLKGLPPKEVFDLSYGIIHNTINPGSRECMNLTEGDLYMCSSKKQSLKKWEVELDIHHEEAEPDFEKDLPESKWDEAMEYCANDVRATEKVYLALEDDIAAHRMLCDITGMPMMTSTNNLTKAIIFGGNRHPQNEFCYRNLADKPPEGNLYPEAYFPGYKFEYGKSTYMGVEVGEGGYVFNKPGLYSNVIALDVASMHPSSIIAENLFGDRYTKRFAELKQVRVAAKHFDVEEAKTLLGGVLVPYMKDKKSSKQLASALKIAINSVYGLTSAKFDNPFKDPRNIDNIVAKRGALFMIRLKSLVEAEGYEVVHIKTDCIKIANADDYIRQFVEEQGKKYGYTFEVEHHFKYFCLYNGACYAGLCAEDDPESPNKWELTAVPVNLPYISKRLFTHEEIDNKDLAKLFSITGSDKFYVDMNEELVPKMIELYPCTKRSGVYKSSNEDPKLYSEVQECYPDADLTPYHNYRFIGKTAYMVPIKPNCGGGSFIRKSATKSSAPSGTKGYRWMEYELAKDTPEIIYEQYWVDQCQDVIADTQQLADIAGIDINEFII